MYLIFAALKIIFLLLVIADIYMFGYNNGLKKASEIFRGTP